MDTADLEKARRIGSRYTAPKRVVFVVNTDNFFLSHRATWAVALVAAGSKVVLVARDTGRSDDVRALGVDFHDVNIGRETSSGVASMAIAGAKILLHLLRLRPGLVFLVHQVAYTIGWPAALVMPKTRFIRVAGGVGRALDPSVLDSTASRIVQASGRTAARLPNVFTLFQIEEDREHFSSLGLIGKRNRSCVIAGTGLDVEPFATFASRDFSNPVILFASRLFREKGIYEFIAAAEKLRGHGWKFRVAGSPDDGVQTAVSESELDKWRSSGAADLLGHRSDMAKVLGEATIFVFPTRHPEGTPKVLIEAGASGLPSIVSGHPGCRAVVQDGVTGVVLGPQPSVKELAAAIKDLAGDPERARQMGAAASELVAKSFSLESVLSRLLDWKAVGATIR